MGGSGAGTSVRTFSKRYESAAAARHVCAFDTDTEEGESRKV